MLGLLAALGVHCSPRAAEPELPTAPLVQPLSVTLADCNASSLIKAINDANTAGAGPHTIALRGGCTYSLVTRDNYWYGPNGLPPITSDITIDGGPQGASIERAAGSPAFRLFYVASAAVPPSKAGSLTLRSVTVRSGLSRGGNTAPNIHSGGGGLGAGGAIFAHGNVNLDRVLLQSNVAQGGSSGTTAMGGDCGGGGGMGGDAGGHGGGGFQSAVGDDGGDGVMGGEGGHSGDSLMGPGAGGSDTSGNENGSVGVALVGGNGGGTRGLGARGALASGTAGDGGAGAGARVTGGGGGGGAGFGGSGGNGITTVTQGTSGGGGGFGGGGGRAQNGGGGGGGGGVGGGGGASIGDAGGSGGGGFGGGGGSCYAGGTGGFGGGGGCGNTGSASGIFGGGSGGVGAPCSGGGGAGFGGAVFVHLGTLTLTNSTLTGNSALGGAAGSATGGGLGTVGAGLGGAVFNLNGTVNLTNATLSGNVTSYGGPQAGGALYMTTFGVGTPTAAAVIKNSILAGSVNTTAAASGDVALNQVIGTMTFDVTTANIIQAAIARVVGNETVTGTPMMASPNLDTLKNNGGPTQTLAPLGNSPAVDTADDATCLMTPGEGVDQRNFNRPIGVHCDIGAFEVGAVAGARNGAACTANDGCASSFCADGFCCNTSCGGGVATDCVSCAAAQSGGKNGVCSTLPAELKFACRPVGGSCDVEEVCDGTSAACPADKVLPAATVCMAATTTTQLDATCDGTAPACPSNPPAYQLSGGGLGGCTAATGGATAGASGAAGAAGAALAMAALLYTARRRSRRHLA